MSKMKLVKLSRRAALNLLKRKDCKVKLDPEMFDENTIYTTDHTWYESGCDVIFIKEQKLCQDLESISSIWDEDNACWLEVQW